MNTRIFLPAVAGLLLTASLQAAVPTDALAKVDADLLAAARTQGQVEFLVALDSRADLAMAEGARTREAKGAIVVQLLKAHATNSQAGLLQHLAQRGLEHRSFWIANVVSATGALADIEAIARRADVAHIYRVKPEIVHLPGGIEGTDGGQAANLVAGVEAGVNRVKAPAVWTLGFRGEGVVVGDHDIGVFWEHAALKKKYRGWDEATASASHDYNWRNAFPVDHYCTDPGVPCDSHNHGTHTTGTMVGDDGGANQIGVAPGAKWIACRSLYDNVAGLGTVPTYLDCMEWMLAPYPINDPSRADPARAPDVVNNSWGCVEACAPPVLKDVNDATYAAGILQVVSAGNDDRNALGLCSTVAFPLAVYDSSFTVGATTTSDAMSTFSSRGPVLSDGSLRIKPNVVAPGVSTRSALRTGGYGSMSGTSMAGPHVAGVAALLLGAEPRLKGRVAEVRRLIELTANPAVTGNQALPTGCGGIPSTTVPNNMFGHGRVDALAAVQARPRLTVALTAPASASIGAPFEMALAVSQPASGRIDVTGTQLGVVLAPGLGLVSASPAPDSIESGAQGTTLRFGRAAVLAPGAAWNLTITAVAESSGSLAVSTAAEADQVSPVAGGASVEVADPVDPFAFIERTGVATNAFIASEAVTVSGFSGSRGVSMTNGQFSVNGGLYTTVAGQITAGQTLRVRHLSASTAETAVESAVTVGEFTTTYRSVTSSVDRTPDAFGFETQTGVGSGATVTSNAVTPVGYTVPVSVAPGPGVEYSVNGVDFTTMSGTIAPGQSLQVRHVASTVPLGYTRTYVKVGGVAAFFTTRTGP